MNKELVKKSIVYNMCESVILDMYDELELKKKYKVIRKLDIDLDEYLEFVNDDMICYSYEVENDKYLVIVVEDLRVLYLILNKEYEVVDEYILKDEELNDLMYI